MKTIEQAAKEYSEKVSKGKHYRDLITGFKAGVEFAQRWIPVEEELPVFDKTEYPTGNYKIYSVKILTGSMSPIIICGAAHLVNDKRWSCESDWSIVTHWRPIDYK